MDMKHPPLAVPLVLLFMMGYCLTGGFNVMSGSSQIMMLLPGLKS